jgi:hypothetical protein
MSDQVSLFATNGDGRKTKNEVGLRDTPPGAERLLAELVKAGLSDRALPAAARICLLLDEGADR